MRLTLTFNSLAAMGNVVGQGGYNTAADVASTDTGRHASPSDSVASDSLSAYSSVIYVRQGRHQTPLTRQLDPPPASSLPAETLMTIFRMLEPQMPEHPTWHDRTLVYEFRQSLAQVGGVCRTWARASRGVQELIAIVTGTRSAHKLVKRRETRGPRLHSVVIDLDTGFKLTSLVKMCMPVLYLLGYDVAFLSDASYEQMDTPISPHCRALSIKRPYTRSIQFVAEASSGTRLGRLQSLDFGRQIGSEASYRIAAAGLLALAPDIRSLRLQLDESFRTGHTCVRCRCDSADPRSFFRTVARSTQQLTHLTLLDPACAQITALCRLLPGNAPVLPPEDPEAANRWPNLRHLTISVLPGELSHMHQPVRRRSHSAHLTMRSSSAGSTSSTRPSSFARVPSSTRRRTARPSCRISCTPTASPSTRSSTRSSRSASAANASGSPSRSPGHTGSSSVASPRRASRPPRSA